MSKGIRTVHQEKILKALDKVYDNLLAHKKKLDSPLVTAGDDGKIILSKPWLETENTLESNQVKNRSSQ
jgi:hypothetical protein